MSQLYDECCPPGVQSQPANPIMYYDVTLGDPASQGIVPPYPSMRAVIFEDNGAGAGYVWNPSSQSWK
jgi:hypothetical protein